MNKNKLSKMLEKIMLNNDVVYKIFKDDFQKGASFCTSSSSIGSVNGNDIHFELMQERDEDAVLHDDYILTIYIGNEEVVDVNLIDDGGHYFDVDCIEFYNGDVQITDDELKFLREYFKENDSSKIEQAA